MQKWVCFSIAQQHKDTENARTIRRNLSAGSFGIWYLFGANLLLFWQALLGSPKLFFDIKITYGVQQLEHGHTSKNITS